jgi:Cytochrome P460
VAKPSLPAGLLWLAAAMFSPPQAFAQQTAADGPRFSGASELVRPADVREWVFVSSGLGMTYTTPAGASSSPSFTNVYVNPSSYRSFMKTGQWPDKTMFVLEIRSSASEGSINKGGSYQTSLVAMEAAVKDAARYPGAWAYFNFGRGAEIKDRIEALPATATCYACHSANTAVDNTFVQFYPTLLDVARRMGTVKASFADVPVASH